MDSATLILSVIAAGMLVVGWRQGVHVEGVRRGARTLGQTIPLLLIAFALTGFVTVLAPQDLVTQWIGPESGLSGVLISEVVGMLLPGGPYVIFPLIAVLYETGGGVVQVVTIITSWASIGLLRLAFEIPFMGWRFSAVRWGLAALVPLAAGLALLLFRG